MQAEYVGWVKRATEAEEKAAATQKQLLAMSALVDTLQAELKAADIQPIEPTADTTAEEGVPPDQHGDRIYGWPFFAAGGSVLEAEIETLVRTSEQQQTWQCRASLLMALRVAMVAGDGGGAALHPRSLRREWLYIGTFAYVFI